MAHSLLSERLGTSFDELDDEAKINLEIEFDELERLKATASSEDRRRGIDRQIELLLGRAELGSLQRKNSSSSLQAIVDFDEIENSAFGYAAVLESTTDSPIFDESFQVEIDELYRLLGTTSEPDHQHSIRQSIETKLKFRRQIIRRTSLGDASVAINVIQEGEDEWIGEEVKTPTIFLQKKVATSDAILALKESHASVKPPTPPASPSAKGRASAFSKPADASPSPKGSVSAFSKPANGNVIVKEKGGKCILA